MRIVPLAVAALTAVSCTSQPGSTFPTPPPNATESTKPGTAAAPSASVTPLAPPSLQKYCHSGDPLLGVYSPRRLKVKNPCVAVTGTVRSINREHDGDLHISLAGVDSQWLNSVNLSRTKQDLVVEAVPAIPVTMPQIQSRVTVIGAWVLDSETGWLELHPLWAVVPAE